MSGMLNHLVPGHRGSVQYELQILQYEIAYIAYYKYDRRLYDSNDIDSSPNFLPKKLVPLQ